MARHAAPSTASGSPVVGRPRRHGTGPAPPTPSRTLSAATAFDPDEGPPRERGARLGRFEQEGARPAAGELAVHADRGLGVGEQGAGDRHQPVGAGPARSARLAADHEPRRGHRQGAVVEAAARAGVAGRPDLVDPHQQRVAVAVQRHRPHALDVPGGVALDPVLAAATATSRWPGRWSACGAAPRRPSSRPSAPRRCRTAGPRRRPARPGRA